MNLKPAPLKLLEAACKSLTEHVVPSLQGTERYEALLAVSAMGIVMRELSAAEHHRGQETKELLALLGNDTHLATHTLEELHSALADAIRANRFTGKDETEALMQYLTKSCQRSLEVTNPKAAAAYTTS